MNTQRHENTTSSLHRVFRIIGDTFVSDEHISPCAERETEPVEIDVKHLDDVMDSLSAQTLMDIFSAAFSALSLIVLTPQGTIVFANPVAVNGFAGVNQYTVKGKHLTELTPEAWANERINYMQLAAQTCKSVSMIDLIDGKRLFTVLRPVEIEHKGQLQTLIFITVEPVSPLELGLIREQLKADELITAEHIDLGQLSVLTSRELEVLALMGQGLRQKEIATTLCRSISTIDRHRERIGEKLGITDRADLIVIAREAVLDVEDAKRIHVSLKSMPA